MKDYIMKNAKLRAESKTEADTDHESMNKKILKKVERINRSLQ